MMTYSAIYDVLARYASDLLPVYADPWSRFPTGRVAQDLAETLRARATCYDTIAPDVAQELRTAASVISNSAQ